MSKVIGSFKITPRHDITPRRVANTFQTAVIQIEKTFVTAMREIAHQHTRLRANWTQANRHAGGSNTVVVAATELASASSQIDRHSHTKTSLIGARRYRQRRRRRDASWLHASCVRSYRPKLALVPPSMTEQRHTVP